MATRDILQYLVENVGVWVHNQHLRAVAGIDDVPRVIRLLRQQGWPVEKRRDGYSRLTSTDRVEARGIRETISQKTRYMILHRHAYRCRACGHGAADDARLVIDHIVPVDWGGTNALDNLQALCEACNQGKQAWVADLPADVMATVFSEPTVERRIEALFEAMPDRDVPSHLIQFASGNALDWQRALRKARQRSGKNIVPVNGRTAYRYVPGPVTPPL